jgi:diadenosine tetraphosphate (Ap4A) HIT family hydrolase
MQFDRSGYLDAQGKTFHHPDPGAPIHLVVIPKAHVAS